MAFILKAIGFSDEIPGFPFTPAANEPGRTVYTSPQLSWTLRPGTQSDDAQVRVSIFSCAVAASAGAMHRDLIKQLAQSAMRRAKSLMIPGFLKCLGAVEYRDTIYIATEPCLPLKDVLESPELRKKYCGLTSEEYTASVAYGLDTIGGALSALQSNRLVHGNLHCGAVFASTTSGFWRLFGLEMVSPMDEVVSGSPGCLFEVARRAGMVPGYRCPPELGSGGGGGGLGGAGGDTGFAVDAWGMACLLYETVGVSAEEAVSGKLNSLAHSLSAAELRNACRLSLPKSLHQGCSNLTATNPRLRKSIAVFLDSCEFVKSSPFVTAMRALTEVLLMDLSRQVHLAESLTASVDTFPLRACLCFVLPRLGELVRAAAKTGGATGVSVGPVVGPVLKVADRTPAGEDFDAYVAPVLLQLYQSPDVLLRYNLLLRAEAYADKVSTTVLCNALWPLYAKGFSHSAPSVREHSARALVHLAPRLSDTILADQVPKALSQLQRDPDGALRANATIALHLVSEHINPPTTRAGVMLTYCRPMLRDAFEPSRVAALRSLHGALDCMSAKQLAESVLPVVAPLTADVTSTECRTAALGLLKASFAKLEANHKQLASQQMTSGNGPAATGAPSTATPGPTASPPPSGASSESATASGRGWGIISAGGFSASPAPAAPAAAAPTAAPTRHVDAAPPHFASSGAASPPRMANPTNPTTTTATASAVPVRAFGNGGLAGTGWSDEDEGNDGHEQHHGGHHAADDDNDNDGWGDSGDEGVAPAKPAAILTFNKPSLSTAAAPGGGGGGSSTAPHRSVATMSGHAPGATTAPTGFSAGLRPAGITSATPAASPSVLPGFVTSPTPPSTSTMSAASGVSSPTGSTLRLGGGGGGSSSSTATPGWSTVAGAGSAAGGPMKLRKKGGLGAARLE